MVYDLFVAHGLAREPVLSVFIVNPQLPVTLSLHEGYSSPFTDRTLESTGGQQRTKARPWTRGSQSGSTSEGHQSPEDGGGSKKKVGWYDAWYARRDDSPAWAQACKEVLFAHHSTLAPSSSHTECITKHTLYGPFYWLVSPFARSGSKVLH